MSSKSKSTLSESPSSNKASPATPRVSKLSRGVSNSDADSPSPVQNHRRNHRLSVDRASRPVYARPTSSDGTRSINSKLTIEHRSPKLTTTPPDKQQTLVLKTTDLQAQLNLLQEDLNQAREQLLLLENEKVHALYELKGAQQSADEANEKLKEALAAQKRAEDDSEVEKFRALEIEQASLDATQKKDYAWQKEIETVKNQHALDLAVLLSTTEELQRVKKEMEMTSDARNQAMSHAEDATKLAEIHVEKVEFLAGEVTRLKGLLESKIETEANENNSVLSLNAEIETLKQEIKKMKCSKDELVKSEACIEQLNVDLEASKIAESYARSFLEEWKFRIEELENRVNEASKLEISTKESIVSLEKQLEEKDGLLKNAQTEISVLVEKADFFEISMKKQKDDFEELECRLNKTKEQALEMEKLIESLKSELEIMKMERDQALINEKNAALNVECLLEEKTKLINDLENSIKEEEKSKVAMEGLTAALHEVSSEARESKEKILASQAEHEKHEIEIKHLKSVMQETDEKYEDTIENAKQEIASLTSKLEQSKNSFQSSKAEWEEKEHHLLNSIKQKDDENSAKEKEINRMVILVGESEEDSCALKQEVATLKNTIEDLKSVMQATNEKYETMLEDAKHEIASLTRKAEHSENCFETSKVEWEKKELNLVTCMKEKDEHNSSKEKEINRLLILSKEAEEESRVIKEDGVKLRNALSEAESETHKLKESLTQAKNENTRLKDSLLDKETEFQSVFQENEDLRNKEAVSLKKIEEISKLLDEAMAKKHTEENGDISDTENDYDLLPKVVEFSEENGHAKEEKSVQKIDLVNGKEIVNHADKFDIVDENLKKDEIKEKDVEHVKGEFKMWESCKIEEKDYSQEESCDDEVDSKISESESFDPRNGRSENPEYGGSSPLQQQQQQQQEQKKKKPLLRKFGNLLKKKSSSSTQK